MEYEGDWTEQAGISIGEHKSLLREIEELKKTKELYDFLKSFMKVRSVDLWENDAFLEMKTLYFQFSDNIADEHLSIDYAIDAAKHTGQLEN